jgi:hypothetical protein
MAKIYSIMNKKQLRDEDISRLSYFASIRNLIDDKKLDTPYISRAIKEIQADILKQSQSTGA